MFDEITRVLNHLMWLGAHALDIGAMTVFLLAFKEREELMDLYEAVSGTRMHATYYRPGGVYRDLPDDHAQVPGVEMALAKEVERLNEARSGLDAGFHQGLHRPFSGGDRRLRDAADRNRIWKQRTVNIGVVSPERAMQLGFSGPMLRGSGIEWDLRKKQPYEVYERMDFDIPVGVNGDCYDRYLVRVEEMRQSNRIVQQCVEWLEKNPGPVMIDDRKVRPPSREQMKEDMESLIHHFKSHRGYEVPEGETYAAVEAPKGEFGIYLISDGANKPYRLKCRAPGFPHLPRSRKWHGSHVGGRRRGDRYAGYRVAQCRNDGGQRAGGGDGAIELPPAVVGDDDPRRPVPGAGERVVGAEHALDDHRQPAAQLADSPRRQR